MTELIALVALASGYLAGRLHGKSAQAQYLAEGFRIMRRQAIARGLGDQSQDDLSCSAADVSRAFGTYRRGE